MSKLENEINKKVNIEMELTDSFECRFMGKVETYNVNLKDKDFKYTKSILHKCYKGASVLPMDKEGNLYLEIQYRFPVRRAIIELPAGRAESNETYSDCAMRELREETGCVSDTLEEQTVIYAQPEFTDEQLGSFFAQNCVQTEKQELDSDESVYVIKVPFENAVELIKRNVIIDERTIIAIGICRCIQGLSFPENVKDSEKYLADIKEKIKEQEISLEEKDIDIDYIEVFEFGVVKDHIVKVPGDKNSRRECFYLKSGNLVIPISENGKIGFKVRYMPAVKKNMIVLPEKAEFDNHLEFEEFGEMVTAVGYSNDRQYMLLTKNLKETDDFIWMNREEILDLIKNRKLTDGRAIAAVLKYLM